VLGPGDILVGHSGGGYEVTLAADAAPEKVGHIIYLAAGLPLEGRPLIEASGGRPAEQIEAGGKTQLMTEETGMMRFIRRNERGRMECCDFEAVRDFFYHDCDEASARWAYARLSPAPPSLTAGFIERLGVEPLEIDASHSPFLSRPRATAELFVEATRSRPVGPLRP